MRLARVVSMRPADMADRLRQENFKVLERLHIVRAEAPDPRVLPLERFRQVAAERFFAGATTGGLAQTISEHLPVAREHVLRAASELLAGRFDLLGYRALDFGDPIAWRLDPLSGVRSDLEHWTRIDPLDRRAVGDHKVVWELSRQQWLLHWAQAYLFTHDETYAERCFEAIDSWIYENPVGMGIHWVSSLELAFRSISWCWVLVLLRDSAALRSDRFARALASLHAHATHVARYLSTTYSPNTHLLGEALGLFYVGVLFPELEGSDQWRATGNRILRDQSERQILPDGVCFEQSTYYQRYTVEMYLHFLLLAARNRVAVPAELATRVERSVDFLLALSRADGTVPQIGDSDGGWLLPFVSRAADDMRGTFALAATVFARSDLAEAAGGPQLEALWLCGQSALRDPAIRAAETPSERTSQLFADGGYAVLRSEPWPHAHKLTLDVGPLGCPASGGHGHADLLAVTCDLYGQPCIVDPGMPTYGGEPAWRDAFRSSGLHSTLTVDGLSQAVPAGPFSWKHRPRAWLRAWTSNDEHDFVDGEHDAYASRCNGLRHRRRVVLVKPRYFVIIDDLHDLGHGIARRIDLAFQFAPRYQLSHERPWARAISPEGHALLVHTTSSVQLEASVHQGVLGAAPLRGWYSPAYGRAEAAPALIYHATVSLPFRVVTYLVPVEHADAPLPTSFPPSEDAALLQRLSA